MTTDEQEALSKKYGAVMMVLPLESGKFAVFGPNRELHLIGDEMDVVKCLLSPLFWSWAREQILEVYRPRKRSPAINLEDIGEIEI